MAMAERVLQSAGMLHLPAQISVARPIQSDQPRMAICTAVSVFHSLPDNHAMKRCKLVAFLCA